MFRAILKKKKCVLVFLFVPVLVARFCFFLRCVCLWAQELGSVTGALPFFIYFGVLFFSRLTCQERQGNPAGPHGTLNAKISFFHKHNNNCASPQAQMGNPQLGLGLASVFGVEGSL